VPDTERIPEKGNAVAPGAKVRERKKDAKIMPTERGGVAENGKWVAEVLRGKVTKEQANVRRR